MTPPPPCKEIDEPKNTPKQKQNQHLLKIQRDLNSPSASTRLRALRALKSPGQMESYTKYDLTSEIELVTEEERNMPGVKPRTLQDVLKDVVFYVEVRTQADNRTSGIKEVIRGLGATVNDSFLKYVIINLVLFD